VAGIIEENIRMARRVEKAEKAPMRMATMAAAMIEEEGRGAKDIMPVLHNGKRKQEGEENRLTLRFPFA
jgi:hypothetical protein